MNIHDLWVEKYRPNTVDGYVFKDELMKKQVEYWIENPDKKKIPFGNLLLSGSPGVGKTTLALMLLNVLNVNIGDILVINASRENNVETVREKIISFASSWPIGNFRVIILDEADNLSQAAQMTLRAEIEKFAGSVRFILTCNYPNKILPAIHSRLQQFHIDALDMESFILRVMTILAAEEVSYNDEDLMKYVEMSYPDLRKCIGLLDQNTISKVLAPLSDNTKKVQDYLLDSITLFAQAKYTEARKLITSQAKPEEYEEIYRWFYQNLELWGDDDITQGQAILEIARGLRDHSVSADPEINLAATIFTLTTLRSK